MLKLHPKNLKLGDTITVFEGAFGTAVVTQITDKSVSLFRPYATTSNFSHTGGVIPYIGIEQYEIDMRPDVTYEVLQRREIK